MINKKPHVKFVLKFAQGQRVSLQNERFVSQQGDVSQVNEWLERHPPARVYPLFDSAPGQESSERSLGLDRFFCIVLDAEGDEVESRLRGLNRLPFLEEVYIEAPAEPSR